MFFNLSQLRGQLQDFHSRHLAQIRVGFVLHPLRFGQVMAHLLPFAILGDRILQVVACLGHFTVLRGIAEDLRVGHLGGQLVKAPLNTVESVLIIHFRPNQAA